jgi:hypothetical protein
MEGHMKPADRVCAVAIVAVLLLAATLSARAQGTPEERSACIGDAFRFCSADIPNVPQIESCLISNVSLLSPPCKAEFSPAGKSRLHRRHFD